MSKPVFYSIQGCLFVFHVFHSYEATEDNEISFAEGDRIIKVDTTIDDSWWEGIHEKTGKEGLFPCE